MNDSVKRGGVEPSHDDTLDVSTPRRVEASTSVQPPRDSYSRVAGTKAPGHKHFERLEALMQEALDDKDDFSKAQALSILVRMQGILGVDVSL